MEKLLLFVVVLFGTLSMQSLSDAFGCGVTVPIEVCRNPGGNQNNNNPQKKLDSYGAIAVDTEPSNVSKWKMVARTSKKSLNDAIQKALKDCEFDSCRIYAQYKNGCGAVSVGKTKDGKYNIYSATGKTLLDADENAFVKCIYDDKCALMIKSCSTD